jgi:hypothetical protein
MWHWGGYIDLVLLSKNINQKVSWEALYIYIYYIMAPRERMINESEQQKVTLETIYLVV